MEEAGIQTGTCPAGLHSCVSFLREGLLTGLAWQGGQDCVFVFFVSNGHGT